MSMISFESCFGSSYGPYIICFLFLGWLFDIGAVVCDRVTGMVISWLSELYIEAEG